MTRTSLFRFAFVGIVLGAGCSSGDTSSPDLATAQDAGTADLAAAVHWSYDDSTGPVHWGDLEPEYILCKTGSSQSPVDLPATTVPSLMPGPLTLSDASMPLRILNNGHTVQVNASTGSLTVNGTTYNLAQFHFHSPSEHTIGGKSYDLEMHMVHKAADGSLAVLGLLFNKGAENAALMPVWANLPTTVATTDHAVAGVTVDVTPLLPTAPSYYTYSGSLTTPPCSEGVKWLVLTQVGQVSVGQLDAFTGLLHGPNHRPVQPLNSRTVDEFVP